MAPYTGIMAPSTLDAITAEAREIHFTRTVLTAIAAVLFAFGWVLCQVVTWAWLCLAWIMAAVKTGWRSAKAYNAPKPPLPPAGVLERENAALRQELQALRTSMTAANRRQ